MLNTPYYVIDEQELLNNINGFYQALNVYFPKHIIGYSYKTNSLPWIVKTMKKQQAYAEVVSFDEYALAKQVGYDDAHIIYNGPMKSQETFLTAMQQGAIVNIETHREVSWLSLLPKDKHYQVGIRVNYDIEAYCPGESACGEEGGRFGFCYENNALAHVIQQIQEMPHVTLAGLHMHVSSKTRSIQIYRTSAMLCARIKKQYHLDLRYVDIGGGFFGGMPDKPSYLDYVKAMHEELAKAFDTAALTLIVEPGASLVASPVHFVTSVIDVKTTTRNTFVVTDGSRNDIDPLMSKSGYLYDVELAAAQPRDTLAQQVISGFTCMEHDRLFTLRNHVALQEHDRIIYHKVGSYTMCLSPLFIKYFPDVYVKRQGSYIKVREKWTHEDYMQGDIVDERD